LTADFRFQNSDFRFPTAAALVLTASAAVLAQRPQPGVKLPLSQLEAQMFHVSAGKRLKPASWPNGARVAVGLSFDVDNASASLATGDLISESISRGEYGAVDGVPRILRLLDKHQLPASFFIPAVSHLLHPDMIPMIMKSGRHEIGVHGWIHEHLPSVNDAAAEQDMLNRAIETLTKAIGKKPVGYRAPSWQFSQWTVGQVKAAGFLYDSSLMASDDAYEILLDKQATGVVELPIERILDDFPYFGGATNGGMPNPDLIEQVFRSEFDVAYEVSGSFAALKTCVAATKRGGIVVQVGTLPHEPLPFVVNELMAKELDLRGAFRWGIEFDWAVDYISSRKVDVRPLVSGQYPLAEAVDAFRAAADKNRSTKVQLVA